MLAFRQTVTRRLCFMGCDMAGESWPLLASPLRLMRTPVVRRPMADLGEDRPALLDELKRRQGFWGDVQPAEGAAPPVSAAVSGGT